MSALVVDASVAVKWFVQEDDSERATRVLESFEVLHAPRFLKIELANTLWAHVRKGAIGADQAHLSLVRIERTVSRWHDDDGLIAQAFAWALTGRHPIYDFCYLALAAQPGLPVVTADRRFQELVAGGPHDRFVVSLMDVR